MEKGGFLGVNAHWSTDQPDSGSDLSLAFLSSSGEWGHWLVLETSSEDHR